MDSKARWPKVAVAAGCVLVTGALAMAGIVWLSGQRGTGGSLIALLRVDSEPSGATLSINGRILGETPYAGDNALPPGQSIVHVEKAGYAPVDTPVTGGETVVLNLVLKSLKPRQGVKPGAVAASDGRRSDAGDAAPSAAEIEKVRKRDDAEAAKRMGGSIDKDGQFVDPDNAKER